MILFHNANRIEFLLQLITRLEKSHLRFLQLHQNPVMNHQNNTNEIRNPIPQIYPYIIQHTLKPINYSQSGCVKS